MKLNRIYKANGKSFRTWKELQEYILKHNYRISDTYTMDIGNYTYYFIDLKTIKN